MLVELSTAYVPVRLYGTEGAGMMDGSDNVLYADALNDAVVARAPGLAESNTFRLLHTFWGEWTFAWKRCDLKRS